MKKQRKPKGAPRQTKQKKKRHTGRLLKLTSSRVKKKQRQAGREKKAKKRKIRKTWAKRPRNGLLRIQPKVQKQNRKKAKRAEALVKENGTDPQRGSRDKEAPLEYAVPLNENPDSLSPGANLYNSLFAFEAETPQVWVDSAVWNIAYAAVPNDYTIPDPAFINLLRQRVAWQLVEPTIQTDQAVPAQRSLFNTFMHLLTESPAESPSASGAN